jgi:uncharacterized membrane-anchored protein YhcB (DUF1043 family)
MQPVMAATNQNIIIPSLYQNSGQNYTITLPKQWSKLYHHFIKTVVKIIPSLYQNSGQNYTITLQKQWSKLYHHFTKTVVKIIPSVSQLFSYRNHFGKMMV